MFRPRRTYGVSVVLRVGLFVGNDRVFWKNGRGDCAAVCVVSGVVGPRNRVFDGRLLWRHLGNAVERLCTAGIMRGSATRGGDASSSKITVDSVVGLVLPSAS